MDKSVQITLIIVGAVLALALIGGFLFMNVIPTGNTVSAQGMSVVKATPDIVTVYFNVQTNGTTASEAKDKNAEIVDDAITELVKLGLERKDIVTENFNVYPDYSYDYRTGAQTSRGYIATHSIKVELASSDFDKVGGVIDAGVDAGALISYINFELSLEEQNKLKAEALKLAGEDARLKAEATAEGLDKSLGRLVSVSSSNFDYYPWQIYRNADMMSSGVAEAKVATTSIQPGQQEVTASINVVYKIK